MNQLEGLLILLGLPAGLLLTGYWLPALLRDEPPLVRLAVALPAGLVTALATVAAINFFHPLAGLWAYACLATALLPLLVPAIRRSLARDVATVWREKQRPVFAAAALFFACLLWPVLHNPTALFYDGTSNHDSFFWIVGAEHLKRHAYMEAPSASALQPLTSSVGAIVGWKPLWGRMGAEGVLAMASSVVGLSPVKLYLYGTACLAMVWFATSLLALRTFIHDRPSAIAAAALVSLQPIYIFFFGNANMPNLLGTLTGTAVIIGLERTLRVVPTDRRAGAAWAAFTLLSLHGLVCSYPEMLPFVLLPCALLWLRPWFTRGPRASWRGALLTLGVAAAGLALNPATTVRAFHGFLESLRLANNDTAWANLFAPLHPAEYLPAIATLSVPGSRELGLWLGGPLSVLLLVLGALVLRHSRDRFGLLAGLSGGVALMIYTLVTDFSYGWQKTVQFTGIFLCVFPPAALDLLWRSAPGRMPVRRLALSAFGVLAVFMAYTVVMNCREIHKWSERKVLSHDWFDLRDHSRETLRDAPVLIEAATFRMAFFHSMWAAYFLPESHLYFGIRGEESGGYLRQFVLNEDTHKIPPPAAILVGREWADAFDANSPRRITGREFTLLQKSNRVRSITGWYPLNGLPIHATGRIEIELTPHSDSHLLIELLPRDRNMWPTADWEVRHTAPRTEGAITGATGAPPWKLKIPLVAGQPNRVEIHLTGGSAEKAAQENMPDTENPGYDPKLFFVVGTIRIEDAR